MTEKSMNWLQKIALRTIIGQKPSSANERTRRFVEKANPESVKDGLLELAKAIKPRIGDKPPTVNGKMFNELTKHLAESKTIVVYNEWEQKRRFSVRIVPEGTSQTITELFFDDGKLKHKQVTTKVGSETHKVDTEVGVGENGTTNFIFQRVLNNGKDETLDVWTGGSELGGEVITRVSDLKKAENERERMNIPISWIKKGKITEAEVYGPREPLLAKYNFLKEEMGY